MNRAFRLCLGLALLGATSALAQSKPPNIHFLIDTSSSLRELPQVLNSNHVEFFNITTNGCSNPRLDALITNRGWNAAAVHPVPDLGTGLGSDLGFSSLFQDDKFYAYMSWADSTNPAYQWTSKEQACQSQVDSWNTTNTAEYNTCLSCLSSKGYFKASWAEGSNTVPQNSGFILWGRFLNFNPPKHVLVRAAIKQALKEVRNARVGYSYFTPSGPGSVMGRPQSPACDQILGDSNSFDTWRAAYVNDVNALAYNSNTPMARALLNIGYYFTSGDDIYRTVFGFGTSYSYPTAYLNAPLTSQSRSWCWGDQSTAVILISDGDANADSLGTTMVNRVLALNGGPVYCPDWAPCGTGTTAGRDKGTDPASSGDDNPNYMLDDVAKLLATQDLQRSTPVVVGDFNTQGRQSLRIHTISYGYTSNLLRNTAAVGNGLYFTASDPTTLQSALSTLFCSMGARTNACP